MPRRTRLIYLCSSTSLYTLPNTHPEILQQPSTTPSRMESLPNELKENICSYLDRGSLHSLLQVSKQQWAIAEPWIYKHVNLQAWEAGHVRLLLLRLVLQPDLAARIKSVNVLSVENGKDSPSEDDDYSSRPRQYIGYAKSCIVAGSWDAVYASAGSTKAAIGRVTSRNQNHAQECLMWLSSILSPKMDRRYNGYHYLFECLEASLALIVGLAVNLEAFTFHMSDRFLDTMLREQGIVFGDFLTIYMCRVKPELLSNLRQMIWYTTGLIQKNLPNTLHSLEKLVLRNHRVHLLHEPALKLHTLVLSGGGMALLSLEDKIGRSIAPNLERLTMEDVDISTHPRDPQWFSRTFPTTLKQRCPKLKFLQIDVKQTNKFQRTTKFQNLNQLNQLTSLERLVLSSKHLIPEDNLALLFAAGDQLPPNITSLRVVLPDAEHVGAMVRRFLQDHDITHTYDRDRSIWYLPDIVGSTSLKSVELAISQGKRYGRYG